MEANWSYIIGAYGLSALFVGGYVLWMWHGRKHHTRALEQLEDKGIHIEDPQA